MNLPLAPTLAIVAVLVAFEMIGPFSAEHRHGPTPWHPHHIAERYSLLVIIALGEVVLGTILTISAGVQENQWTVDAALLAVAVAATLLAWLPDADLSSREAWTVVGLAVAKSVLTAGASWVMRAKLDPSGIPTPLPPADPGEPDADLEPEDV